FRSNLCGIRNFREGIESTSWKGTFHPELVQAFYKHVPALSELLTHGIDRIFGPCHGGVSGFLSNWVTAGLYVLVHLQHLGHVVFPGCHIPESPASHGIAL